MNPALPPLPNWLMSFVWILLWIGLWCLVVAAISLIGGWNALAKSYRRGESTFRIAGQEEGVRFRWASLSMGLPFFPANYGNCVTVFVGEQGIGVNVMPLFRVLHPPLLIPWNAIEKCKLDRWLRVYWRATVNLRDLRYPVCFYGRAGKEISRAWALPGTAAAAGE